MKNNEFGRSMVEMLGVLAIVGVLSAGALAGYSKAMFRHKVNQTIDIFQGVLQRFSELDQKGWGKGVEIGGADDMIAYGIYPECQKVENEDGDTYCRLPIGQLGMFFMDSVSDGFIRGEFFLYFNDSNSCIAFSSIDWVNAVPIEWWNPNGELSIGNNIIYRPYDNLTTIERTNIIEGCHSSNTPSLTITIRREW